MTREQAIEYLADIEISPEHIMKIMELLDTLEHKRTMNWKTDNPTEDGIYLVTLEIYGERRIDTCYYSTYTGWGCSVYEKILAWDNLPEVYGGK